MKNYGLNQKEYLIGDIRYKATEKLDRVVPVFNDEFAKDIKSGKENAINLFNKIIGLDDELIYIGLWNQMLCFMNEEELDIVKTRVSNEGKEFIETIKALQEEWENAGINPTKDIELKRTILKVPDIEDDRLYLNELEKTGDYKIISKYTVNQLYEIRVLEKPLSFAIHLKENNKMIGTIQLTAESTAMGSYYLEYYIFEEYRNKGYGTEVINGLVDAAFSKKLVGAKRCPFRYFSLLENIDVRFIRCTIRPDNEISIHTIKKCGFEYEGTFKDYCYNYNEEAPANINFYIKRNKAFKSR